MLVSNEEPNQIKNRFLQRQARLTLSLQKSGLHALALNPGASLMYLTGLRFSLSERPVLGIFASQEPPIFVLPRLEAPKTQNLPFPAQVLSYEENPASWSNVMRQAVKAARFSQKPVGIEPRRMRILEYQFLETASPQTRFVSAETNLAELRQIKDESEVAAMSKAVTIAQNALLATLQLVKMGMTEVELASELSFQLLRAGSEPEFPFSCIVSAGPNGANPHASPTERPLASGDLLVIDWGAYSNGYCSDITRTFAIGEVDPELQSIVQITVDANAAGLHAVRPGVSAASVDRAARSIIQDAGYGDFFIHRTGHGLGLEVHEEPYIREDNELRLETGMTFTIEPGIYLPGRGGARIEDNVVVTSDGYDCLTNLPRQLEVVAS